MLKVALGWLDSHLAVCLSEKGTKTKNGDYEKKKKKKKKTVTMEANRQTCKGILQTVC